MNYKLIFATLISRIFDPFVMIAAAIGMVFWGSPQFYLALGLFVFLPLVLFIAAWKTKFISNWDMTDRTERPKVIWVLLGIAVAGSIILQAPILYPYLAALIGFGLITHVWKISGHAFAAALASGVFVSRFGLAWWPVLFAAPLVSWSRVVRKNHTVTQVIAGTLYAWAVVWFIRLAFPALGSIQ